MVETLSTLSVVSFAIAALCLVLAIFFWFFFNIPSVIGDLSGRTARKSIAKMRAANEKSGGASKNGNSYNAVRNKVTGPMSASGKLRKTGPISRTAKTDPLDTAAQPTALLSEETMPLSAPETALLGTPETALLGAPETALLSESQTVRLDGGTAGRNSTAFVQLETLDYVMLIHTSETIND